jgi:hypothetical protein
VPPCGNEPRDGYLIILAQNRRKYKVIGKNNAKIAHTRCGAALLNKKTAAPEGAAEKINDRYNLPKKQHIIRFCKKAQTDGIPYCREKRRMQRA